ncbi:MAG: 50S ribosomal protein L24 [Patescibacteria group bacterium]
MKIKKGDNVIVISGKDKGKTGKVDHAFPSKGSIIITGVNVKKVHRRGRKSGEKGQIVDKSLPIDISNVMLIDPKTNKGTRVGKRKVGGRWLRVAKKSDTVIDK